jgi:hypothetical protein
MVVEITGKCLSKVNYMNKILLVLRRISGRSERPGDVEKSAIDCAFMVMKLPKRAKWTRGMVQSVGVGRQCIENRRSFDSAVRKVRELLRSG